MASVERVRCSGRRLRRALCTVLSVRRICCGGSVAADEGLYEGPAKGRTRESVKGLHYGG